MIYIILPAYNESESIGTLLMKIKRTMEGKYNYKVIVIDDGSTDGTGKILSRFKNKIPLTIIRHRYNRGLGESIRDAFEYVSEKSKRSDIIVRLDADDTHEPKYIPEMIKKIKEENFDIVIASRFQKGGGEKGIGLYRKLISRCANLLMKLFFPIKGVWDYTCGFRAYRAGLIKDALYVYRNDFIELKGLGFTGTVEKLLKLKRFNIKIGEIPFVLRYDQKLSKSKMVSKITILGYLILIIKNIYPWQWAEETRQWLKMIKELKERKQ